MVPEPVPPLPWPWGCPSPGTAFRSRTQDPHETALPNLLCSTLPRVRFPSGLLPGPNEKERSFFPALPDSHDSRDTSLSGCIQQNPDDRVLFPIRKLRKNRQGKNGRRQTVGDTHVPLEIRLKRPLPVLGNRIIDLRSDSGFGHLFFTLSRSSGRRNSIVYW